MIYPSMIYLLLAETAAAAPDTLISGTWLTGFVVAVIGAAAAACANVQGRKKGLRDATNNVTLQSPMPEVPVRKVYSPPSFSQHMDLVRRVEAVEGGISDLRRDQAQQFIRLMEVGEKRKDDIFEKIDTMATGFHSRVNQLVSEQRHHKDT